MAKKSKRQIRVTRFPVSVVDTTIFHVYLPKLVRTLLSVIPSPSTLLIGTSITENYSTKGPHTKYLRQCQVSIYGCSESNDVRNTRFDMFHANSIQHQLVSGSTELPAEISLPHVIGRLGGTSQSYLPDRNGISSSSVWVTFNSEGLLTDVFFNHDRVPHGNIILLEYDPFPLLYCILTCKHKMPSGIPEILMDSFTLVSNIPEDSNENGSYVFHRLVPEKEKYAIYDSFEQDLDESDETAESRISDIGGYLKKELLSRCLWVKESAYKVSLVNKLLRMNYNWVVVGNITLLLMLDVFLGTLLTLYLQHLIQHYEDFDQILKTVLEKLLKILHWLSGAPAGLKLNAPLNLLFHRFYSYHLHLWGGYIGLLEPLLRLLFNGVVNFGYLGLTIQLAMAKDLISFTTFHIYCLYIYATRLFNMELNTMRSLGRLFLGRKWNPLRFRIDSVTLSVSEMFLGASGFTIALFLLPTICVYYIVFLALRLPLLIVEASLKFTINVFNSMEIITAILILIKSSWVGDEIYLNLILPIHNEKITHYEIKTQSKSKKFYKVPKIRQPILDTLSKIIESKIIME